MCPLFNTSSTAFVLLSFFLATGCRGSGNDGVTLVAADDPEMDAAIESAKSTVQDFIVALSTGSSAHSGFSVKVGIAEDDVVEFMWLTNPTYVNGQFSGVITNTSELVSSVQYGDTYTVAEGEIADWMYLDNGALRGGYTIRVLYNKMSASEQARFNRIAGFRIE